MRVGLELGVKAFEFRVEGWSCRTKEKRVADRGRVFCSRTRFDIT